jgi:hypothetical protein
MRYQLTLIALLFYLFPAAYPQIKLKSVLLDDKNNPIPYATVFNKNSRCGTVSNMEGRFEIICQPKDSIVIRCLGYREYKAIAYHIQADSIITMTEAIYTLNEISVTPNNAEHIVRKFVAGIRRNYPKRTTVIGGVYKEYALIDNEYYGFLQCELDILIKSIASFSRPKYKSKVFEYKSFRHPDREKAQFVSYEDRFNFFWLYGYSFLWNFKEYKYHHSGYINFNDSKLAKITFIPKYVDKSVTQLTGTMYIDINTYALIYLQYEMLPNEKDFHFCKGRWQKPVRGETKIMFGCHDGYYYPTCIITTQTSMGIVSDWDNKDTISINFTFNFFTKNIEKKPKGFVEDSLSLYNLINKIKDDVIDQSKNYKSDFILETEDEKRLIEQ